MEKITKKQMYEAMIAYFRGEDTEVDVQLMDDFCVAQIEDLDKKTAKAKETRQRKKAEEDVLLDLVENALTDEFQVIADITEIVAQNEGFEDVSVNKVTARLKKLVDADVAERAQITIGEGKAKRKAMSYRLIV